MKDVIRLHFFRLFERTNEIVTEGIYNPFLFNSIVTIDPIDANFCKMAN